MAKNYVQVGDNLTVPVASTVNSGDVVQVGDIVGIAQTDAKTNDGVNYYTTIATKGVWEIAGVTGKTAGQIVSVIPVGKESAVDIGFAIEASGTASTYVLLVLAASLADGTYTLPAATQSTIGGVKETPVIADLAGGADLPTTVTKVNALLAALRTAGIIASA